MNVMFAETGTGTFSTIIGYITEFVTGFVAWIGDLGGVIMENPILALFCIVLPVIAFVVVLIRRLTNV